MLLSDHREELIRGGDAIFYPLYRPAASQDALIIFHPDNSLPLLFPGTYSKKCKHPLRAEGIGQSWISSDPWIRSPSDRRFIEGEKPGT